MIIRPSPRDGLVAVGYSTGDIRVFDHVTNKLITTLRGHRNAVSSLVFDDKDAGNVLVSGGSDCDVIAWDMITHTGKCLSSSVYDIHSSAIRTVSAARTQGCSHWIRIHSQIYDGSKH